jgi:hypothetical protein
LAVFVLFNNSNKGTLLIYSEKADLTVFVDQQEKKSIDNTKNPISLKLKKGFHQIVLAKKEHWPWIREVEIQKDKIKEIYPFFISQIPDGQMIESSNPKHNEIISLFKKELISPIVQQLLINNNLAFQAEIRALDFYKTDREDLALIAMDDGVYVLEINKNIQNPNFQPVFIGSSPTFVKIDNDAIYILDGNNLLLLAI